MPLRSRVPVKYSRRGNGTRTYSAFKMHSRAMPDYSMTTGTGLTQIPNADSRLTQLT